MKKFTILNSSDIYDIDKETYEDITLRREPYHVKSNNENGYTQYAICPSCENPIQIVGLYGNETERKRNPYGRHTGKEIKGLAKWHQNNYVYCPYADPTVRREPSTDDVHIELDEKTIGLYNFLRDEFDAIVFVLEKTLNIHCSDKFWEKSLDTFLANKAYGYPWVNRFNIPFLFAYYSMLGEPLYSQNFLKETKLYQTLEDYPNTKLIESTFNNNYSILKSTSYIDLTFHFQKYKTKIDNNDNLIESMEFCILTNKKEDVYCENIIFDLEFLSKVIHSKNRKRRYKLLEYAEKVMPPIIM